MILKKIPPVLHTVKPDNPILMDYISPPNKKLILFFAGWGMDEQPFLSNGRSDRDLIIAYDYHSLALDESLLRGYEEIQVFAWSMGVWAAAQVLPGLKSRNYPVRTCTAINGTAFPIDDEKGIPNQVFKGTLATLSERTLDKFRLRMCGSKELLQQFLANTPKRDIESLRKELIAIGEQVAAYSGTAFQWDQAYIGTEDRIFSPENQRRAWNHTPHRFFDAGHYPQKLVQELLLQV
ncbi:DUF452 family protein [Sphingobacterium athyrii]|uniref:DUF452 domain-containing protein n=1 Tax=Sphingobacterium athyrii TaxID=2152717 RepID=A0A363NL68_9SPHI|nr:pimeloyl-ACP methyl esterase BioG family protein [Sphingobacterium athyrii]PUV21513.1 DUF452 domain-containing protein [Sphingobacterium athyrii]